MKRAIMVELSRHEAKLTSNRNGWFVAKKVGLHTFKHRPNDWNEAERLRDRKKRTFSEFLSGPLGPNRGRGPSTGMTEGIDLDGSVGFSVGGGNNNNNNNHHHHHNNNNHHHHHQNRGGGGRDEFPRKRFHH